MCCSCRGSLAFGRSFSEMRTGRLRGSSIAVRAGTWNGGEWGHSRWSRVTLRAARIESHTEEAVMCCAAGTKGASMRAILCFAAVVSLLCLSAVAEPTKLSPADEAAAFKAAGFKLQGKQWR